MLQFFGEVLCFVTQTKAIQGGVVGVGWNSALELSTWFPGIAQKEGALRVQKERCCWLVAVFSFSSLAKVVRGLCSMCV